MAWLFIELGSNGFDVGQLVMLEIEVVEEGEVGLPLGVDQLWSEAHSFGRLRAYLLTGFMRTIINYRRLANFSLTLINKYNCSICIFYSSDFIYNMHLAHLY